MKTFKTKEELRDWAMYIVPEDVKWIAVDSDSKLCPYKKKPEYGRICWDDGNEKGCDILAKVSISFPWQDSLIEIEHPVDLTKYIGKIVFFEAGDGSYAYSRLNKSDCENYKNNGWKSITPLKLEDIE